MSTQKKSPQHDYAISLGYKVNTPEYKRAYEYYKWKNLTPEQKAKKREQQAKRKMWRRKNDPAYLEKERERDRKRHAKKRLEKKDKVNERQRTYYAANKDRLREKIYASRRRRDPTRGLATLIQDVRNGRRDPRELVDRLCDTIDKCSALIHRGERNGVSE